MTDAQKPVELLALDNAEKLVQDFINALRASDHDQFSTWKLHQAREAKAALVTALRFAAAQCPGREDLRRSIGRIIDPQAFETILPASSYNALRKADAIIALLPASPVLGMAGVRVQTIEECAKIAERLHEDPAWSPGYKNASLAIADKIRRLANATLPPSPASQDSPTRPDGLGGAEMGTDALRRAVAQFESLRNGYRGYLPWNSDNSDVKARLMHIQDADKAFFEAVTVLQSAGVAQAPLGTLSAKPAPGAVDPVAWRIYCTNNGATGYLYTEALPFEPGPGVVVRREPEPLYASPAAVGEIREALFPDPVVKNGLFVHHDASDNLEAALIDIEQLSAAGKPTDAVCIRTIKKVIARLELARKALSGSALPADAEDHRAAFEQILKHVTAPKRIPSERLDNIEKICRDALSSLPAGNGEEIELAKIGSTS